MTIGQRILSREYLLDLVGRLRNYDLCNDADIVDESADAIESLMMLERDNASLRDLYEYQKGQTADWQSRYWLCKRALDEMHEKIHEALKGIPE